MNVFNKKLEKKRYGNSILDALQLVIPAVILTADDIWCVSTEQAQQLVKGSFEIIQGYKEEGGLKELHKEFADRGFQIELHGAFETPEYNPIPQRGKGVWEIVEVDKKVKTVCSRCGKGTAVKTNYCAHCGADMRRREDA